MRVSRKIPSPPEAPDAASLYANFLALNERAQEVEGEIEDWNRKKAKRKNNPRRWSKKRLLTPPGAVNARPPRPSGAQPCNVNRLKHGHFAHDHQLFKALVRSHIRTTRALIAFVQRGVLRTGALHRKRSERPPSRVT